MDENMSTVPDEQPQQVALQHQTQDGTAEVVSQEVVASGGVDVDKTLYDAEEFLANFAGLRLENDQLKRSNEELQQQLEKARQDLQDLQIDKVNLEALLVKEREQHKEALWKIRADFQKVQEERLQWKEKYLNVCMKGSSSMSGVATSPSGKIRPGKRKNVGSENENEEFYTNLASSFGLSGSDEQPVAVIILKKKNLTANCADNEDVFTGERHEIDAVSVNPIRNEIRQPPDKDSRPPMKNHVATRKSMLHDEFISNHYSNEENIKESVIVERISPNRNAEVKSDSKPDEDEVKVYVVDENTEYDEFNYPMNLDQQHCSEHDLPNNVVSAQPLKSNVANEMTPTPKSMERNLCTELVESPRHNLHRNDRHLSSFLPSFETPHSNYMNLKPEESGGGPNKASEEISRLVEIDRNVRVALTAEIKERYDRIEIGGQKKYLCKMCQKTFERWCNLNAHVTMHLDMKPYVCKICAVRYKLRSILNDHIRATHLRKPFYKCKACKMCFKHRSSLQQHVCEQKQTLNEPIK